VGRRLVQAVEDALHARGARLVAAEVAADPPLHACHTLLAACGFTEEARVDDYYRDGVPLVVWCRRLEQPRVA
jgi:predicted GNAT superfamily acetyltransferase